MYQLNERSTGYLTVTFLDKDGLPAAPASLSYRIDDLMSGTEIRGETTIGSGASVEIVLSPSDNLIVNAARPEENRIVTISASYGVDDEINDEYEYQVLNLRFLTS